MFCIVLTAKQPGILSLLGFLRAAEEMSSAKRVTKLGEKLGHQDAEGAAIGSCEGGKTIDLSGPENKMKGDWG